MLNSNNYPHHAYILITALNEGNSQIIRDLQELSLLQSSNSPPHSYANTLKKIVTRKITNKLNDLVPNHGIINDGQLEKESENDLYVVLNILPESNNVLRSLPFVTCNAAICKIDDIEQFLEVNHQNKKIPLINEIYAAIVSNPILNLLYWSSSKTNGSYEKNYKIKPAQTKFSDKIYGLNSANRLNLDSTSLELCFVSCGKLDFTISNYNNYCDIIASKYIANQAGINITINQRKKEFKATGNNKILEYLENDSKTV
jgi:fructose-1,6-bisphosphatase/inositol monophosphatase family enzyme